MLLVFALVFLAILFFEPLLKKYLPQPPAAPAKTTQPQAVQPKAQQQPSSPKVAAANERRASSKAASKATPVTTKQASQESQTVIQNDFYRITFSNRGGLAKSWELVEKGNGKPKYDNEQGQPLDLVNAAAAAKYGYPLSLWTYDETLRNKLNSALYVVSSKQSDGKTSELTFEYSDADLSVRKTFRFDKTYVMQVESSVTSDGNVVSAFPAWPAGLGDQLSNASYHSAQILYQNGTDVEQLALKKISGGNTLLGTFNWAGVSDAYFAAAFLPQDPQSVHTITLRNPLQIAKDPHVPAGETEAVDVLGLAVGNPGGPTTERVYVGPKSLDTLESIPVPTISGDHQDLRGLLNFGFWGSLARALFIWLRWTYQHWVPNWGWAIVIQTFIIAVVLFPLRFSQMKSALKMQKVAPQIKAIQEKYKKYSMRDPRKQEMNTEIGAIYKSEGVNPIGGCLPMMIPLILIWPYYRMLDLVIDLRHAHWLWIHDLSSRDPYFLLPIFLVVSQLITQRMMPQVGMDPAQQKMMNWMMPLMMGFFFFNLAAGLNLYYVVYNLFSMVQQSVINRTSLGREMREMALKRTRKQQGKAKARS
jgi:YidC/Oxa1 family membrane protein insertase